ncbi:MAG: rRNA maturation RNase YbeY [Cryobacterium sp.]|nr:rRNA maturation RNase YbeY [Oligoflexia bacterium]
MAKKSSVAKNRTAVAGYPVYDRAAKKFLQTLLPYANESKILRKKAGYSPRIAEPSLGLDVTFVSRSKMRGLNRKFRGKDEPTDVLSFPALEVFARQGHLGDLVICAPVLEKQADEIGHPAKQELRVLLVHGLLHLLGFDHERSDRDASEMSEWEQKILGDTGLIKRVSSAG